MNAQFPLPGLGLVYLTSQTAKPCWPQASVRHVQSRSLQSRSLRAAERYLLEKNAESEASLKLRGGVPVEYKFVGYTEPPHRRPLFRMRLSLRPVLRTSDIDRRLHIERE